MILIKKQKNSEGDYEFIEINDNVVYSISEWTRVLPNGYTFLSDLSYNSEYLKTFKWNENLSYWEDDIEYIKLLKRNEIKEYRYNLANSNFTINGLTILSDTDSKTAILGAMMDIIVNNRTDDYTLQWKVGDNNFINLTKSQIIEIANYMREFTQTCFNKEKIILTQLDNLTSRSEIEALTWETYFPNNNILQV